MGSILLCALLAIVAAQPASAQSETQNSFVALSENGQAVLAAVNQARAGYGLHPLQLNSALTQAARLHVDDMVTNRHYSHTGSDGSSVRVRAARSGYASKQGVSENWVATQNAAGALAWWMNSYVHRNNILNGKWQDIGIGAERDPANGMTVFVLVFGGGSSGDPGSVLAAAAPSPAPQPIAIPAGGLNYTVRPGDTLSGIAVRYGVSWQVIAEANGLSEFSTLQIGQSVRLPGAGGETLTGTGGLSEDAPQYMVQHGDTLSTIALRYDIPWEEIARANGLGEESTLQIGQLLRIPGHASTASSSTGTTDSSTVKTGVSTTTAVPAAATSALPTNHVVRQGETVISIALRYNLDWKSLLAINGLGDSSLLQVGQSLRLR